MAHSGKAVSQLWRHTERPQADGEDEGLGQRDQFTALHFCHICVLSILSRVVLSSDAVVPIARNSIWVIFKPLLFLLNVFKISLSQEKNKHNFKGCFVSLTINYIIWAISEHV